jgi:hypothetical protein
MAVNAETAESSALSTEIDGEISKLLLKSTRV